MAVSHEHEAVHRVDVLVGRLDEREEGGGRNALRLRAAPRQARFRGEADRTTPNDECDGGKRFHVNDLLSMRIGDEVHRVSGRLAQQEAADLLGGLGPHLGISFDAVEGRVGREYDLGMLSQAFVVERLALDDVEGRGGDMAGVEGIEEGALIDDRAAAPC